MFLVLRKFEYLFHIGRYSLQNMRPMLKILAITIAKLCLKWKQAKSWAILILIKVSQVIIQKHILNDN